MRKKIVLISFVFAVLFSLSTPVLAHPGRTDSNGGHWNHASGKYHYHHGYSAHDHYDTDGDGDVDCPYDFDRNKKPSTSDQAQNVQEATIETIYKPNTDQTTEQSFTDRFGWIIPSAMYLGVPSIYIAKSCIDKISERRKKRPFGKFTVYIANTGKTFHKNQRCSRGGTPAHIYEISQNLTPCRNCAKKVQYPVIIPSWYKKKKIKKKRKET